MDIALILAAPLLLCLLLLVFYGNYQILKRAKRERKLLEEATVRKRRHKRLYIVGRERD